MDYENFREIYKEIALEIDIETAKKIHKMFGGLQINFPKKLYCTKYVNSSIREKYNGSNIKELAIEFGLSERRIKQILHSS